MITNNWKNFMKAWYAGIGGVDTSLVPVVDLDGTVRVPSGSLSSYCKHIFPTNEPTVAQSMYTDKGVWFGDGNAEPSPNDYCLSGNRVTTYNVVGSSTSSSIQGDEQALTCVYTLQNTGTEQITISEVCWVACINASNASKGFVLDRTLLETPVVIPPGEQGVVLYRRSITI